MFGVVRRRVFLECIKQIEYRFTLANPSSCNVKLCDEIIERIVFSRFRRYSSSFFALVAKFLFLRFNLKGQELSVSNVNGPARLAATHLRSRRVHRARDFRLPIVVVSVDCAFVCFRHVYREGKNEAHSRGV